MNGIAHSTATALQAQGFSINQVGNATTQLGSGASSEILYGPSGYGAAVTLGSVLSGGVTYMPDSSLSGQTVSLLVAGSQLSVTGSGNTGSTGTGSTTTTVPTGPTTSTTTTIPSDVYTNTQPEPWNPYPCTPGQSTQASPSSTTTTSATDKKGTASDKAGHKT